MSDFKIEAYVAVITKRRFEILILLIYLSIRYTTRLKDIMFY